MGTERLPLFPLHTVLMPGMELPLHIFEPRYRLMVQRVLQGDRCFGVLLIRRGEEVGPGAEPYDVGTVASITAVVPLEGGRMKVSTVGTRRFRVTAFCRDQPYLTGDVEYLSDEYDPCGDLRALQAEVERLSRAFVTALLALQDEQAGHVQLPDDALALSYKVAGLLVALWPAEAQHLLESPTVAHRLAAEVGLLRRELAILRRMGDLPDCGHGRGPRVCPN